MRVLLTRALEDAARTRAILEDLGHDVMVSPVIAFRATGASWPGSVVDAVVATSGQAFASMTDDNRPLPEARRLMPLWLVGERTRDAARAKQFIGPAFVAPNAKSLAGELRKVQPKRVIYLASRDRKPDIERALVGSKQVAEVIDCYEAHATGTLPDEIVKSLEENSIDLVLHFSRRSASLFLALIRDAGLRLKILHLCLSQDVAAPLEEAGWQVLVPREPTEASLIARLAEI